MTAFVATCAVEERGRTCDAPTQAFLCDSHRDELVSWLWDIGGLKLDDRGQYLPSLLDELDTTITGDDKIGGTSIGIVVRSAETPLPFKEKASDVKHSLINAIVGWTRLFAEDNPHLIFEVSTVEQAAQWMAAFPNLLAGQVAAVEMHSDIRTWVDSATHCIDRPVERTYAGMCTGKFEDKDCATRMFALVDRSIVTCPKCEALYYVDQQWRVMEELLRAKNLPARAIADALKSYANIGINVKTIRSWGRRGQIPSYGTDKHGSLIHNVGETLDFARSLKRAGESACIEAA